MTTLAGKCRLGALLLMLIGCSKVTRLSSETYPKHENKVCILEGPAPQGLQLTPVADLNIKLNTYGGDRRAKSGLAKYARKLGAHAVVNAEFANMMGAPRGSGRAVRFVDPQATPPTECQWY